MTAETLLTIDDHDRAVAGLRYVYPVVSRRAGGVSVGINLNVNHACNWRCVYCQVPNLSRGGPVPVDLDRLEAELRQLLTEIVQGDYLARHVPEGLRRLNDVAFSGNGEPTMAAEFPLALERVARVLADLDLPGRIRIVLITNGSQMHRPAIQTALRRLAELGGEVWFKLDRGTREGLAAVNSVHLDPARHYRHLAECARRCPTWVQTCLFRVEGLSPSEDEVVAYLGWLRRAREDNLPLEGVLLYGLARPSMQPEAACLDNVPGDWLEELAERIRALGWTARVHTGSSTSPARSLSSSRARVRETES